MLPSFWVALHIPIFDFMALVQLVLELHSLLASLDSCWLRRLTEQALGSIGSTLVHRPPIGFCVLGKSAEFRRTLDVVQPHSNFSKHLLFSSSKHFPHPEENALIPSFSGANHSQVPSESLMKLEPDLGILGFPSFPLGWSRFWLFFPTDNSTAIICLVYPWGIFTAYRLKFMTADQVSHTLMSPRILGIINDTKQCFIYVIILKSSMFRHNFARSTVPK